MKIGPDLLNVMTTPLSLMPRDSDRMTDDLIVAMRSFMNCLCISERNINVIIDTIINNTYTISRSDIDTEQILDWVNKMLVYVMDSLCMLTPRDTGWFLRTRYYNVIDGDNYLIVIYGNAINPLSFSNKLITNSDNTYPYFKE